MTKCARCGQCWRVCPQEAIEFFASQGYERHELENLIKVWREVASEFMTEDRSLMLKKLREKRIMQPL